MCLNRYKAVKIAGKKYDQHRIIAGAENMGRDIVVHHKDGDKANNAPDNLEVITRSEHCRLHGFGIGIRPKSMQIFAPNENGRAICRKCNRELPWEMFLRDKNAYYGRRSMCRECASNEKKKRRKARDES